MPYGRPADTEFHRHWSKVSAASAITKGKCYACRYCHHKLVYNTGNMRRHLETCEKHLKVLREYFFFFFFLFHYSLFGFLVLMRKINIILNFCFCFFYFPLILFHSFLIFY